jgi:hypothetical protein
MRPAAAKAVAPAMTDRERLYLQALESAAASAAMIFGR